ncbi:hypothetical protein [Inquilinus sp. OTU3971]|uniref:hypothetical protein n=1 Tax=Inquilinus sp. OTU3971 TaxID=3043855 RepID=UPI00313F282E
MIQTRLSAASFGMSMTALTADMTGMVSRKLDQNKTKIEFRDDFSASLRLPAEIYRYINRLA